MKFLTILILLLGIKTYSQLAIGKQDVTNSSVILEFGNDGNKGLILPYVDSEISDAENGTFILDRTNNHVKVRVNSSWMDLSNVDGISDATEQTLLDENTEAGVILGADTSNADGALVLESPNQAMVLPIVNEFTDIINPSAGMMVYLRTNKRLAVFNGSKWTFWKSENQ